MANQWFKFYGQDWLTDIKIIQLKPEERLCYLTLLCLASISSDRGTIKDYNEDIVIQLTQLLDYPYEDNNEYTRAKGFTKNLIEKEMVHYSGKEDKDLTINNFLIRQETNLTNYEMVNKSRLKKRIKEELLIKDKDTNLINDKVRIDKNRIDKNIYIVLFNFWNDLGVIRHKVLTDKMRTKIKSVLNDYTEADICAAMTNYAKVIKGPEYFFKYKWTLDEFLSRGLVRFLEAPIDNWLKEKGQDTTNSLSVNNPKWKNL